MNVGSLFKAIREAPDQATLIVATLEFERQGYTVLVNNNALLEAEDGVELDLIPKKNGVKIVLGKGGEIQSFRIQFLDVDAIYITDLETAPVIYDPEFTTGFFESAKDN